MRCLWSGGAATHSRRLAPPQPRWPSQAPHCTRTFSLSHSLPTLSDTTQTQVVASRSPNQTLGPSSPFSPVACLTVTRGKRSTRPWRRGAHRVSHLGLGLARHVQLLHAQRDAADDALIPGDHARQPGRRNVRELAAALNDADRVGLNTALAGLRREDEGEEGRSRAESGDEKQSSDVRDETRNEDKEALAPLAQAHLRLPPRPHRPSHRPTPTPPCARSTRAASKTLPEARHTYH